VGDPVSDRQSYWFFDANILFNVQPVYTNAVDLFNALLDQGVIFYSNGKLKVIALPLSVVAKCKVFGIDAVFQSIATAAC